MPDKVATVLAQICCYENVLPQGAPTSPIIANMICGQLDDQLLYLAKKHGCRYTRYADDITFSSSRIIFPPAIASSEYEVQTNAIAWHIGVELEDSIQRNGFKINAEKARMQIINQHQEVTGLTINQFPNVKRQYVRQIRAMLHAWEKHGLANAHREYYKKYDQKPRGPYKSPPSFKQIVKGKIDFLGMVRGHDNPTFQNLLKQYETLVLISKKPKKTILAPMPIAMPQEFSFSQWIETLPFPLASILRIYDADDDEKEKYARLLKFFEALAAFWATILLSGYHGKEGAFTTGSSKQNQTFKNLSNPTFGTWVHVVKALTEHIRQERGTETFSRLFKTQDSNIFDMLTSLQLVQILDEARELRNDFSHSYISRKQAGQKHDNLNVHLNSVVEIFAYRWSNYRLITPLDSKFESALYDYRIEHIIGSNPPFKKTRQTFVHPLENRNLYFAAPDSQQALQLLPLIRLGSSLEAEQDACYFYNGRQSDETKWATYHLEDGKAQEIRSLPEVIRLLDFLRMNELAS